MARKKTNENAPITDRAAAYAKLKTQYGDVGRIHPVEPVHWSECLQTPSMSLNLATNEGGLRPGSILEVYGMEGTMKTTFGAEMIREAQHKWPDKCTAFIDTEEALDLWVAENRLGIDRGLTEDRLPKFDYFPDPENDDPIPTMEMVLNRIHDFAASGLFSLIVLDSVAATQTLYEKEQDDITKDKFGGPALPMSKSMKKIKAVCRRTGTIVVCLNQMRDKTVQTPTGQITKKEPSGGNALRFAATHRFKFSWIKKETATPEQNLNVFIEKLKYGQPWTNVRVPILLGKGVDVEGDLVEAASSLGVVKKSGSYYYYNDQKIAQGLSAASQALQDNPELKEEIKQKVLATAYPD